MFRFICIACVLMLPIFLYGCTSHEATFFPITKGSFWKYTGKAGNSPQEMSATVTSSGKHSDSVQQAVIQWSSNGHPFQDETYLLSSSKLERLSGGVYGNNHFEPSLTVLQLPLVIGKSWEWKGRIVSAAGGSGAGEMKMQVTGRDELVTKAGKFTAFRVAMLESMDSTSGIVSTTATLWFADGVGLVKQESDTPQPDGSKLHLSAELEKYEIK